MLNTDSETLIESIGRDVAAAFPSQLSSPRKLLDERLMEFTTRDPRLQAALFRFVDVVPACRSSDDLSLHLAALLQEAADSPTAITRLGNFAGSTAGRRWVGSLSAAGVRFMAGRFIVAESPEAARSSLRAMWRRHVATSVDLLGEATVTRAEADAYTSRCAEALHTLASTYSSVAAVEHLDADSLGLLPRANLSVKVSAMTPLLRPEAPYLGGEDAAPRLRQLLRQAHALGAHLHIDTETLDSREAIISLVLRLLDEDEFRSGPSAGIVVQAYLRDSPAHLDEILDWACTTNRTVPLVIRLVKGAYWDHEVVAAQQNGWPIPVFEQKADTDRNYESLTTRLLDARPSVRVAFGSHNLRSIAHAIAANRERGGRDSDLELQVLRGLGDDLQYALAQRGFRVRTYCPVGDLVAGMGYLVRRLLENTANTSFLHQRATGSSLDELLAAP